MTARGPIACVVVGALLAVARVAHADASDGSLAAEVIAGAGLGTRSFERPTAEGTQALGTTAFPAAEVGLRLQAWPQARFSLAALARLQTSLGLEVEERPLFALPHRESVRAQHLDLGLAPHWRLGAGPDALAVAFPVGLTLRSFRAETRDVQTPSYSLVGPHLRVELVAPLTRRVELRIGPEAHGLVFLGRELRDGGTESLGFALGGQAALRLTLPVGVAIEFGYRESHAWAGHRRSGPSFQDVERFAIARIVGTL
jgi:hypothetical protein